MRSRRQIPLEKVGAAPAHARRMVRRAHSSWRGGGAGESGIPERRIAPSPPTVRYVGFPGARASSARRKFDGETVTTVGAGLRVGHCERRTARSNPGSADRSRSRRPLRRLALTATVVARSRADGRVEHEPRILGMSDFRREAGAAARLPAPPISRNSPRAAAGASFAPAPVHLPRSPTRRGSTGPPLPRTRIPTVAWTTRRKD
jgi:hypothetical protein